ncbi:Calcium calmodulin-dependent protein kinase kinase 2 [Desmophyllum pertusum]|uniref:non-specific serine/threonine protein kinase n=1 Tax=Desmophyllum pertusum TaxID=174260 RepID=A0A9X0CF34_9CNID|nr:Calcium calmodulin-dependent protein kinase kinase 2 [Desmophyllum pertusum]
MLTKDPNERITIRQIKEHHWVTHGGKQPLLSTEENCIDIEVTDDDIQNSVKTIPKIKTLILVKSMLKFHTFGSQTKIERIRSHSQPNIAPEIHETSTGKAADIWALGITLSAVSLEKAALNPQLEDVILRMLTKDPNERITIRQIKILVKSMLKFHTFGSQTKIERIRSHSQPTSHQK